jgi:acyl-CoA thioesterase-1
LAAGPAVIACFGDSLTAGYGLQPGQSYPDILQRKLDRTGQQFRVVNLGVSGETSGDGLARLRAVLALKPDLVVLEFGANDGLRGVPVRAAAGNLERMIRTLRNAGARVVLAGMTLPPVFGADYNRRFQAMYCDLAVQYDLTLIPFFLEGVAGHPAFMQPDGLHPNAEGARRVAETVFRVIRTALPSAR